MAHKCMQCWLKFLWAIKTFYKGARLGSIWREGVPEIRYEFLTVCIGNVLLINMNKQRKVSSVFRCESVDC